MRRLLFGIHHYMNTCHVTTWRTRMCQHYFQSSVVWGGGGGGAGLLCYPLLFLGVYGFGSYPFSTFMKERSWAIWKFTYLYKYTLSSSSFPSRNIFCLWLRIIPRPNVKWRYNFILYQTDIYIQRCNNINKCVSPNLIIHVHCPFSSIPLSESPNKRIHFSNKFASLEIFSSHLFNIFMFNEAKTH